MDQLASPAPHLRPDPDVVARRLGDGAVLVHLQSNRIFELNDTGMRIWELVSDGLDEAAIARALTQEFEVEVDDAARSVRTFLEHFSAEGLLR